MWGQVLQILGKRIFKAEELSRAKAQGRNILGLPEERPELSVREEMEWGRKM